MNNNLKTAVVVAVLLAVLYGVYTILNKPQPPYPEEDAYNQPANLSAPEVSLGAPAENGGAPFGSPTSTMPWGGPTNAGQANYGEPSPSPAATGEAGFHFTDEPVEPAPPNQGAGANLYPPTSPPEGSDSRNANFSGNDAGAATSADSSSPMFPQENELDSRGGQFYGGDPNTGEPPPTADLSVGGAEKSALGSSLSQSATEPESSGQGGPPKNQPQETRPQKSASGAYELGQRAFERAWNEAMEHINEKEYREALALLTPFYGSPDLNAENQQRLVGLLDPLAGKVIYSTEDLLTSPHIARRGETLQQIAKQYDVPWRLLQNINGVKDPEVVLPATKLKVVRGPFRAEVQLSSGQMTLFVENLYAGRFDIETHRSDSMMVGQFRVQDKREWAEYTDRDGRQIPARDPNNPYGQWLIDLGGGVCFHEAPPAAAAALGCISLSPQDAADVFSILSVGSKVEIRK